MPDATLTVLQTNDLLIRFNDTISETTISNNDLNIRIYGSSLYYVFNWTAEYMDKSSVQVYMNIQSKIYGGESILVDFVNTNKFKSVYSKRGVNPKELAGKLFENKGSESSSDSLGQTAMILFLFSLFIALISSFGGNSMEMTWNLMNTLQLLFYLSYVYVNFPEHLSQFFGYLKYANAENQYLSSLTFWIVSRDNFKRGHVNDRLDDKAFFVNSADKVPVLLLLTFAFVMTMIFDYIDKKYKGKCNKFFKKLLKLLTFLKYNFFIRFGMEIFLELTINSLVNVYWYDVSTGYEVMSFCLAAFFLGCSLFLVCFCTLFIITNQERISHIPDKLENYTALFMEINNKNEAATYYYIVFFVRRIVLAFGFVFFYMVPPVQICICICSSGILLYYISVVKPYKENILNISSIFNESCVFVCSLCLMGFTPIKIDGDYEDANARQINLGWVVVAFVALALLGNCMYLFPVKLYETYMIFKQVYTRVKEFLHKRQKAKIVPTERVNQTEAKIYQDTGSNVGKFAEHREQFRRKDKTQDQTGLMSNLTINVLQDEDLHLRNYDNNPIRIRDENEDAFGLWLKDKNTIGMKSERLQISKMKDSLKQKIMKANFQDVLTVRNPNQYVKKMDNLSPLMYSRNVPAEIDSIEINSIRSIKETPDQNHSFRRPLSTAREIEGQMDIKRELERNQMILTSREEKRGHKNSLEF